MFKLNRKIEFALIALRHMLQKRPGELTSAKEIADTYGCSFDTVSRVLQILAHKEWLHSSQGISGGYLIIRDLNQISFYDLSEAIVGPIKLVRCISSSCQIKTQCNIVHPVQTLNQQLTNFYKNMAVLSLLEDQTNPLSLRKTRVSPAPRSSSPPPSEREKSL